MRAGRYARICVCLLNTYLSFLDAAKLKASLHNKVGIVTARLFGLPDLHGGDETCSSHHGGQQRDA
jgi:hypothetical protein